MKARKEVSEMKQSQKKDNESGIVLTSTPDPGPEDDKAGEPQTTEMLIAQGGDVSNADEPDGTKSGAIPDDGYNSPTCITYTNQGLSGPSSITSSPTKQCDSAALVDSKTVGAAVSFDKTEDDDVIAVETEQDSEHNSLLLDLDAKALLQAPQEPDATSNLSFLSEGEDESITVIDDVMKVRNNEKNELDLIIIDK